MPAMATRQIEADVEADASMQSLLEDVPPVSPRVRRSKTRLVGGAAVGLAVLAFVAIASVGRLSQAPPVIASGVADTSLRLAEAAANSSAKGAKQEEAAGAKQEEVKEEEDQEEANATAANATTANATKGHEVEEKSSEKEAADEDSAAPAKAERGPKFAGCKTLAIEEAAKKAKANSKKDTKNVQKELWGQCGGTDYDGPTECKEGMICVAKKIEGDAEYKQCRQDPDFACASAEGRKDMKCYYKVKWDMETGINTRPDMYHGLTAQSTWSEFQEQNYNFLREKSGCPQPCAPGTCYEVLHMEGCDDYNEWACAKDDHSLAFDCCCKKYHPNVTKAWVKQKEAETNEVVPANGANASLFCIALVLPGTYEVDLMRMQFQQSLGIFDKNCDEWAVFSNESLTMNCDSDDEEFDTVLINGSLEAPRGGKFNTSMNTVIFERFWERVMKDPRAWKHDWIVKVDPDTLFLPGRLRQMIASKEGPFGEEEPAGGMYINNCFLGMHGPIEVFTKRAMGNYFNGRQKCADGAPGEHGQEDWYLRSCFKMLGIEKVDAFNILMESENACKEKPSGWEPDRPPCFAPEVSFHPFKNIESMMHCWAEAVSHQVANLAPVSEGPSPSNNRHG